jgi:hypothetical protein
MSESQQQKSVQSELSDWEVMRDDHNGLLQTSNKGAAEGWTRFGVRHVLLWMTVVALFASLVRLDSAFLGEDWGYPDAGVDEILIACAGGTIVGLGLPIVLTGPTHTQFLDHPARVLFALLTSLVALGAIQRLTGNGFLFGVDGLSFEMGVSATAFVWALYASIRSRIGWLWRIAMILICLQCILDFVSLARLMSVSSAIGTRRYASYIAELQSFDFDLIQLFVIPVAIAMCVFLAGVVEMFLGRFKDWRTWIAMTVVPVCLIVCLVPVGVELWRSHQLDIQTRVIE